MSEKLTPSQAAYTFLNLHKLLGIGSDYNKTHKALTEVFALWALNGAEVAENRSKNRIEALEAEVADLKAVVEAVATYFQNGCRAGEREALRTALAALNSEEET